MQLTVKIYVHQHHIRCGVHVYLNDLQRHCNCITLNSSTEVTLLQDLFSVHVIEKHISFVGRFSDFKGLIQLSDRS